MKLIKTVAKVATLAVAIAAAIPTGGTSLLAVGAAALGTSAIALTAGAMALSIGTSLLFRPKAPATSAEATDRLTANIDPRTPRKFVFGTTAFATDIRDQELTGNDKDYLHRFIVCASHKTAGISEIWLDDKLAWSATGGVTSAFAGYFDLDICLEGSAAEAINIGPRMGTTRRYTGLTYVYFRFKLTGNSKKAQSPFAQSVPSRVTIIGNGALTYDPRLDSTVPGGSGPMRANDQTTWTWNANASRNPAIQLLWYLLGWRIQNPATGQWRLAVGKGIPAARIDLPSFITAANLCDEPVTLIGGGTQPRYRSDGLFSEGDATSTVLDQLKAAMNAELDDVDGKIRLTVLHNDLATPIADFSEDDILSGFTWEQTAPLDQMFNVVRGTFIDPSQNSLYQAIDYPEVRIPSPDGIDRIETVNFQTVQDGRQAQRLAKQRVARMLYSGRFTATFSYRAWKVQKNDVIRLTFAPLGWTNKLFRVIETAVQVDGQVPMVLQVEHPDIYLWDRDERADIQPVEPTTYDPYLNPVYQGIEEAGETAIWDNITGAGKPEDNATVGMTPTERDEFAQLEQDTAAAQAAIAAAQGRIDDIEASIGNLDLDDLNEQIGAIESDLSGAQTSITNLQTQAGEIIASVGQVGTRVDQVESSVSTLGGSVSTLSQTVTNLNGTVSTLSQTVSTQGGQISSIAQSVTTLSGTLSSLNTIVTASSSPNLIQNGGFENMLRGWSPAGQWGVYTWAWGRYAECTGYVNNSGQDQYFYLTSDAVPCAPGPNPHAQSFDYELSGDDGVLCYGEIVWLRDDNSYITQTGTTVFGRKGFDQSGNSRIRHVHTAPSADTAKLQARVVFKIPAGATATGMRFRQLKVELGSVATPYSGEATAAQSYQAFSDLNSSFASLSTTVSSQGGSITTLQQSFTSINGTVSSLSSTVTAHGTSITSLQQVQATQSGTIASLQQRSTVGGNLLNNSEFAGDASSWNVYIWDQNSAGFEWGRDLPDGNWRPNNEHMLALHQTDSNAGRFSQWFSEQVNIVGGRWYEGSAHTSSHRCYTMLRIDWYDGNGSGITSSDSNLGWSNGYPGFFHSNGGTNLGNWQRLWVKAQAPLNATRAILTMVKTGTSQDGAWAGATDSWAWFARPQLSEIYADTVMPVAYFPGRTSASFASQQTAINGLSGQYASLSSTVATQGASISQNATAISNLQGSQASLSSTVSTQGAAITNLQTATSTLQGNVATLTTQVTAGSPNLIRNGSFEMGNLNYWSANGGSFSANPATGTWGSYAGSGANVPDGSYTYIDSNSTDIERDWHTLTADVGFFINGGSGSAYLEIIWFNGSGVVLGQQGGASRPASFNFTSDGATRRLLQVTAFPPEGTVRAAARIVWYKANGVAQSMHVRQVKLERGQVATPYSADASVTQSFQALSTLDTQYASLSSTVGVLGASVSTNASAISTLNGNVATLFAQWVLDVQVGGIVAGIKLANNGSASSLKFRADLTEFTGSTSTARAEFRGGTWFGYDDTGRKRYQIGNMALS